MRTHLALASCLFAASLASAATGAAAAETVSANTWPERPVKVIVGFAPGGPTDLVARLISQQLSAQTGKNFFVENLSGAGGNVGTVKAAQSPPDGYTILVTGGNITNNPFLFAHPGFDTLKDFDAVTLAAQTPVVLAVNPAVPAKTGPAVEATVGNHTPISFGAMAPAVPLIKNGDLRALAVTGKERSPTLPDIPTMAEAGFPEVEGATWTAVVVPAGTPKDIVAKLHDMIVKSLGAPDVKDKLAAMAYVGIGNSPEQCVAFFKSEMEKWGKVIKDAGLKAE